MCNFLYKTQNNLIKTEIVPKLNSEIHSYMTRNANKYHIDPFQTKFGKFAILREAIHVYNEIPSDIKKSPNLSMFKNKITNYFINLQCI